MITTSGRCTICGTTVAPDVQHSCGGSEPQHFYGSPLTIDWPARVAHLEQELARWKICTMCGEAMEEPGFCANGTSEQIAGLEAMNEQTLHRAEVAEARVAHLEQELAAWKELATRNMDYRDELLTALGCGEACSHAESLSKAQALLVAEAALARLQQQMSETNNDGDDQARGVKFDSSQADLPRRGTR